MAKDALIGTGLVGSALLKQRDFDFVYNSRNAYKMKGGNFDTVYCAAMPGTMWKANLYPNEDRATLEKLFETLNSIKVARFILISTIAVYENHARKNEGECPFPDTTYGKNRRDLEVFVENRFPNHLIVRLPALIDVNLTKGPLYDIKYEHEVEKLCPSSFYQYYPLKYLNEDISLFLPHNIKLVNFVTPPISMENLAKKLKPGLADKMVGENCFDYWISTVYWTGYIRPFPQNELKEYFDENVL